MSLLPSEVPTHLYKYVSLNTAERVGYLREILVESRIYLSPPAKLNDPFEAKIIPDFGSSSDVVERYWRERRESLGIADEAEFEARLTGLVANHDSDETRGRFNDEISKVLAESGVWCMSSTGTSVPMWSYYADAHRGVCVRLRMSREFVQWAFEDGKLLLPVEYRREYPQIKFYEATENDRLLPLFKTKALGWQHEAEWRIVGYCRCGHVPIPAIHIDGVVLGALMLPEERERVLEMVRLREVPTEVVSARIEARSFAISIS